MELNEPVVIKLFIIRVVKRIIAVDEMLLLALRYIDLTAESQQAAIKKLSQQKQRHSDRRNWININYPF